MKWLQKISTLSLRMVDECTGYAHGQTDCIIRAYFDDQPVGYLKYAIFEGNTYVQYVEVPEEMRRQGIATQLYEKLKEVAEGKIIHTNQTPDGESWVNSLQK